MTGVQTYALPISSDAEMAEAMMAEERLREENQQNTTVRETPRITIFDRYEYSIIYYIVKYGNTVVINEVDEDTNEHVFLRVIDYIVNDFDSDEIILNNPLYAKMYEMAKDAAKNPEFDSTSLFVHCPDITISQAAVNMIAEKYTLSKIHTKYQSIEDEKDRLKELIPRVLFELKDAMIRYDIKLINDNIKKAGANKDMESVYNLMNELKEKNEFRTALAKELGERIVMPR